MRILNFHKFQESLLSDTRYNDLLKQYIEDDDNLREYCPCEESNSCNCNGDCNCEFCKKYNQESIDKDYTVYEPTNFDNSLTGMTNI